MMVKPMKINIDVEIGVSDCGQYCFNCEYCNVHYGCKDSAYCSLFFDDDRQEIDLEFGLNPDSMDRVLRCQQCLDAKVVSK